MEKVKKIEGVYVFETFKDGERLKVSNYGYASKENAKEYLEMKGCVRKYKDSEIEDLAFWKYDVYAKDGYDIMITKLAILDFQY